MTKEQQIQYAIKAALQAKIAEEELEYDVYVHGIELDNDESEEYDEEKYPCIVIVTGIPVPLGHKSQILDIPMWIRVMSYLPDDKKRQRFSQIKECVFDKLHDTDDWVTYQSYPEAEAIKVEMNAVTIDNGEEPTIDGDGRLTQSVPCTVHAENKTT
jgi:hypothetical protein